MYLLKKDHIIECFSTLYHVTLHGHMIMITWLLVQ